MSPRRLCVFILAGKRFDAYISTEPKILAPRGALIRVAVEDVLAYLFAIARACAQFGANSQAVLNRVGCSHFDLQIKYRSKKVLHGYCTSSRADLSLICGAGGVGVGAGAGRGLGSAPARRLVRTANPRASFGSAWVVIFLCSSQHVMHAASSGFLSMSYPASERANQQTSPAIGYP